jgi:hypothetical protein
MGARRTDSADLAATLDALPGWGPVTVNAFLRELRGVWQAATPPVDPRAELSAHDLGLVDPGQVLNVATLEALAGDAGLDVRDVEAALIRRSLGRRRDAARRPERSSGLGTGNGDVA